MRIASSRSRAAAVAAALAAILAGVLARWLWRRSLPGRTLILSPRRSTVIAPDRSVRSVQSAELALPLEDLNRVWKQANLENLARTYWLFLERVSLGAIRVLYTPEDRRVVLFARPLTLLRFWTPEYRIEPGHGTVTWRIRDGVLVAQEGRGSGFLAIDVKRHDPPSEDQLARVHVTIEVANFYPSIAARLSTPVYMVTQSFAHVLLTHAFLRSLAKLELAQSQVRRLPDE